MGDGWGGGWEDVVGGWVCGVGLYVCKGACVGVFGF